MYTWYVISRSFFFCVAVYIEISGIVLRFYHLHFSHVCAVYEVRVICAYVCHGGSGSAIAVTAGKR